MFDSWGIDWKIEKFVIVQCLIKSNQKIPSELTAGFLSKEVQLIRDTIYARARARACVCVCVCVCVCMISCTDVQCTCVYARKRERGVRVQRGWKSQFRRISANGYWPTGKNAMHSPQKTIIINILRSANFKLKCESFFYNQLLTHAIFQYPHPLSTSRIMDHLGSLSSQMRTGITYNAARMNFSVFLARLSAR